MLRRARVVKGRLRRLSGAVTQMRRIAALGTAGFGALLGLLISFAPACDPLYEPPLDGGYKPCCEGSRITSCPCQRGESCVFTAQACAGGACVAPGSALTCAALSPMDSGTVIPGLDGGIIGDAGSPADAGSPGDAGHNAVVDGLCPVLRGHYLTSCDLSGTRLPQLTPSPTCSRRVR